MVDDGSAEGREGVVGGSRPPWRRVGRGDDDAKEEEEEGELVVVAVEKGKGVKVQHPPHATLIGRDEGTAPSCFPPIGVSVSPRQAPPLGPMKAPLPPRPC